MKLCGQDACVDRAPIYSQCAYCKLEIALCVSHGGYWKSEIAMKEHHRGHLEQGIAVSAAPPTP